MVTDQRLTGQDRGAENEALRVPGMGRQAQHSSLLRPLSGALRAIGRRLAQALASHSHRRLALAPDAGRRTPAEARLSGSGSQPQAETLPQWTQLASQARWRPLPDKLPRTTPARGEVPPLNLAPSWLS